MRVRRYAQPTGPLWFLRRQASTRLRRIAWERTLETALWSVIATLIVGVLVSQSFRACDGRPVPVKARVVVSD